MATINELKTLIRANLLGTPSADFTMDQSNEAFVKALLEKFNIEKETYREVKAHKDAIFALLEEEIDQILPKRLENIMGGYAEIKTFPRKGEVVFEVKGLGKQRARMGITEGARGGIYKARVLDNRAMSLPVKVQTVGIFLSLEDIISGEYTLSELMSNILDGFQEKIYIETVAALRTAKTVAPASNSTTGNGVEKAALRELIRITGAYGKPMIIGFRTAVSQINNAADWVGVNPSIPAQDLDDLRKQGFVGSFEGTPIVELPNYLKDETNSEWVFDESDIFILPAGERPIKIALKGDLTTVDFTQPSGSIIRNIHKMVGVGLLLANSVCVYTDTSGEIESV